MEISHITGPSSIKAVHSKAVSSVKTPEDTVCISQEAEKMERWVQMLHEMPDIRFDHVAAALRSQDQWDLAVVCPMVAQEIEKDLS